jgi:acetyl-CoA acetyltransferase
LDCCFECDGGVAVVVTREDRGADAPAPAVAIKAAAQGCGPDQHVFTSWYRGPVTDLAELDVVARQLWRQAGIRPSDVDCAMLYDHFTPFVLMQLEQLGFCRPGEAPGFVADGGIDLDGRLPVNPNGGQLAEGYMQGMNGIVEAVRQLRGIAANQVAHVNHVLVTGGSGIPSSGLVLGRHD